MFRSVLRPCINTLYNQAIQGPLVPVSVSTLPQVLPVPPPTHGIRSIKVLLVPLTVARRLSSHSVDLSSSQSIDKLPPLQKIRSKRIRKRVFAHNSLTGGHDLTFQLPEGYPNANNEELAFIGDQVVGLALTDLIQHLYPHSQVGLAAKVRDYVKSNSLISELCVLYGLHKRLNVDLPEDQARNVRASRDVQVDVFKAYVAGVYREQGFEAVSKWLFSVFRPHVEATHQAVREVHRAAATSNNPARKSAES